MEGLSGLGLNIMIAAHCGPCSGFDFKFVPVPDLVWVGVDNNGTANDKVACSRMNVQASVVGDNNSVNL